MLGRGGPEGSAAGCLSFDVGDQFLEVIHEFRVVILWFLDGERDDLAVTVDRLAMVPFGLVQPAKALIAVMDVGEAGENVVGAPFSLIELLRLDQSKHRIGRIIQIVVAIFAEKG